MGPNDARQTTAGSGVAWTYWARLHHFLQGEVHPGIARYEMAVQRLSILEFHQHGMPLGGSEEAQW